MANTPRPDTGDTDLEETVVRRTREASPERSVLEGYSGREEQGGFLGERNDDEAFDEAEDAPPFPLDRSDDVAPSAVPEETPDGLDETEEEVRRMAEDVPTRPGPPD